MTASNEPHLNALKQAVIDHAATLGLSGVAFTSMDALSEAKANDMRRWLAKGYHGQMQWLEQNSDKRLSPQALFPEGLSVISARLDYWPSDAMDAEAVLDSSELAYVSRYALGRDYHKTFKQKLKQLGVFIAQQSEQYLTYRPFVDSAPVMERELAERAGMGWVGKHSLLINARSGSYFFLGELMTNVPFATDDIEVQPHCGDCTSCITRCPTNAIVEPYVVDARRCISYLTIEHKGEIDEALRPLMGNRIYGCDDCQMACPWNRFTSAHQESDFSIRHGLDQQPLSTLLEWDEATFLARTEGMALRRAGHESWQRNIAIAMGNMDPSSSSPEVLEHTVKALVKTRINASDMVKTHIDWALQRLR